MLPLLLCRLDVFICRVARRSRPVGDRREDGYRDRSGPTRHQKMLYPIDLGQWVIVERMDIEIDRVEHFLMSGSSLSCSRQSRRSVESRIMRAISNGSGLMMINSVGWCFVSRMDGSS